MYEILSIFKVTVNIRCLLRSSLYSSPALIDHCLLLYSIAHVCTLSLSVLSLPHAHTPSLLSSLSSLLPYSHTHTPSFLVFLPLFPLLFFLLTSYFFPPCLPSSPPPYSYSPSRLFFKSSIDAEHR